MAAASFKSFEPGGTRKIFVSAVSRTFISPQPSAVSVSESAEMSLIVPTAGGLFAGAPCALARAPCPNETAKLAIPAISKPRIPRFNTFLPLMPVVPLRNRLGSLRHQDQVALSGSRKSVIPHKILVLCLRRSQPPPTFPQDSRGRSVSPYFALQRSFAHERTRISIRSGGGKGKYVAVGLSKTPSNLRTAIAAHKFAI